MKQFLIAAFLSIAIVGQAFAGIDPLPADSIVKIFKKQFPGITDYKLFRDNKCVHFGFLSGDQIRQSVTYDTGGNLVEVIKYYQEGQLDPFIREKVKSNYPQAEIGGVTECISPETHFYEFVIYQHDTWSTIRYSPDRKFYRVRTYRKPGM